MTEEALERRRLQKLEKAGIKVLPAAVRYSRSEQRGTRASGAVACSGSRRNAAVRLTF